MVLEGKVLKESILLELEREISLLDIKPTLVVISVGDDLSSMVYVSNKEKMSKKVGINFIHENFSDSISTLELVDVINKYNNDDLVDGIIVQMPLPNHIDTNRVINAIDVNKDIDGLTDINSGKLIHNTTSLVSCTSLGIIDLLRYYNVSIESKNVVIVGRSNLVSKPLFSLFLNENATVTMCHSKTNNLSFYTKNADILVVSVGKKGFITRDMIKEGSIVIDVGINVLDGKLYGDVCFDDVKDICDITPVPGGIGQVTVAEIGRNVLKAYYLRRDN